MATKVVPWLISLLLILALAGFGAGLFTASSVTVRAQGAAPAQPAAPAPRPDDELVLLTSTGQIRVDDPYTPPGFRPVFWNSGTQQGWTLVAAGDFNGDGDAEIVAAKGDTIRTFDPFVQPGRQPVDFERSLGAGRNIQLLVTGDFDGDGRDEIAFINDDPAGPLPYSLGWCDGGTNATAGEWTVSYRDRYPALPQDMSSGDVNNDGADDLVVVSNSDRRIKIYDGRSWSVLAEQGSYPSDWYAVAAGNLTAAYPGAELALERQGMNAQINSLLLLRVAGAAFVGLGGDYKYVPDFTSMATGDLNGDGDDEVLMLRDPILPKISLFMVNPAGPAVRSFEEATGNAAPLFTIVRTGDVDGDDRAEVIIERADRYRIYAEPQADNSYTDTTGAFYTTATVSNLPTMAVANIDGPGVPSGPVLSVSPQSLSFDLTYLEPSPSQNIDIMNTGTAESITWQAQVITGAAWLQLNSTGGTTPGTLGVSVDTSAVTPGAYTGRIRISATSGSGMVYNSPQDVTVDLTLRAPAPTATPTPTETTTPTVTPTSTPTATATPPGDVALTGLVFDASNGVQRPIPHAIVAVTVCLPRSFSTTAGLDGRYTLFLPTAYLSDCEHVTLSAQASGYRPFSQTVATADLRAAPQRDIGMRPLELVWLPLIVQ